jgi:hypothetical protein
MYRNQDQRDFAREPAQRRYPSRKAFVAFSASRQAENLSFDKKD